jgi:hypothetical protein
VRGNACQCQLTWCPNKNTDAHECTRRQTCTRARWSATHAKKKKQMHSRTLERNTRQQKSKAWVLVKQASVITQVCCMPRARTYAHTPRRTCARAAMPGCAMQTTHVFDAGSRHGRHDANVHTPSANHSSRSLGWHNHLDPWTLLRGRARRLRLQRSSCCCCC